MIVETIGISGVGKTHLYLNCRDCLPANYRIYGRHYKESTQKIDPVYLHIANEQIDITARDLFRNRKKLRTRELVQKELYAIEYKTKFLKRDIWQQKIKYNVWNEEGMYHLFWTNIKRISEYYDITNSPLVENRAFIYVSADPETIAQNIYHRRDTRGHIRVNHIYPTHRGLIKYINKSLSNMDSLLEFIDKHNIPILKINTDDTTEVNKPLVLKYLSQF